MNSVNKFKQLCENSRSGIWAMRMLSELEYLLEISRISEGKYQEVLNNAINQLWDFVKENGAITKEIVLIIEEELYSLKEEAEKYTVLLVGHAHIDMNWMWGFQETASVTVDTFETVLKLMEEYPQFKFSQSQASVYAILDEYYPELLEKIKKRIKEGRWEVTASSWVENDKNMSGSESMARHILYTKNYLSKLLDIPADSLCLDFEPDTFGHSENMPELFSQAGIKYYYHCRGYEKEHIYRWQAPSGAEVLTYREPVWYNAEVLYDSLSYVPSFCNTYGLQTALKMYGVGDHGGGPTRRDIERWLEMQTWPFMPVIKFGTLSEFYGELEKIRDTLPIVKQELNYVFTGCYTSQSKIKKANKCGEDRLFESEVLDAMAHSTDASYRTPSDYQCAWKKILFNQFHDILPGSGTVETGEYALGEFQKAMAVSQINLNHAMRQLAADIDTERFGITEEADRAFGAGAGFGSNEKEGYMIGYAGRAGGKRRIIHLFNTTQFVRREMAKVIIWDWEGDPALLRAYDTEGNEVKCQISEKRTHYWDHIYYTVVLDVEIEPFGYETYILDEIDAQELGIVWRNLSTSPKNVPEMQDPRVDYFSDQPLIVENRKIRAVFDKETMKMISLYDKETAKEFLTQPVAYFREILENNQYEMTSWRVGNYAAVYDINENSAVRIECVENGELLKRIAYRMEKEHYTIHVEIILEEESTVFDYHVEVEWHETGNPKKGVPQLNFMVPLGYSVKHYACAVPFGVALREGMGHDVPCLGFMGGVPKDISEKGVTVMADCKYGFRGFENSIAAALLRSSYDPDEMPEQGKHQMRLGIGVGKMEATELTKMYECYIHPLYACTNSAHKGKLPPKHTFFNIKGDVKITAVKMSEDKKDIIIRMYSLSAKEQLVTLFWNGKEKSEAEFVDVLERKQESLDWKGKEITFMLSGNAVRTICLSLNKN